MQFTRYFSALLTVAALALLTGCGAQGNPQPPSLELPKPVADLRAARKGDRVLLNWTAPRETTDKLRIKEAGTARVCRATAPPAAMECSPVAEVPAGQAPAAGAANFTDTLPRELQEQNPTGFAVYTVEAVNARGRSAGLSNQVRVPLTPTLPPPGQLFSQVTAEGPVLSWVVPADKQGESLLLPEAMKARSPVAYSYRLYRRDKERPTAAAVIVPIENAFASPRLAQPNLNVRDTGTEWEKTYLYWVTTVTRSTAEGQSVEVEGEDSPPAEVSVHDVFPPAAPTAVQAVASSGGGQNFIDLTWTLNGEADLAGYNVYRREGDAQPQKINAELVKTPAFRDPNVTAGHTYFYSVSAVDLRNNESGRSEEESETVPQP
ncbi:MAG TPA: fibronectin type III domain-containing protein [Terriglobales bacterium]|nr:fibronectin type III domain-containing protein [Terriglobales bacterium]